MKTRKKKGCGSGNCNPMTPREFLQVAKDFKACSFSGLPTLKQLTEAVKNPPEEKYFSYSCSLGNYYPKTQCFHWWNITPSSEDKGYCSPDAYKHGSTYPYDS